MWLISVHIETSIFLTRTNWDKCVLIDYRMRMLLGCFSWLAQTLVMWPGNPVLRQKSSYRKKFHLQLRSKCTVVATGRLILLLEASQVSSANRSDLERTGIWRSFFMSPWEKKSLVSINFPFLYHTTPGAGTPVNKSRNVTFHFFSIAIIIPLCVSCSFFISSV